MFDKNHTPLQLGDFVCPRYYTEILATTANEEANVYQIVEEIGDKIIVQKVSDPTEQIVASSDFFISLE